MEERIKELEKLTEELVEDGADIFLVVMEEGRTVTRTSLSDDRAYLRVAAALGRVAKRRLKRR